MLSAIHAQESKAAALAKAKNVVAALKDLKLKEAAKKVEDSVEETLTYMAFPFEHWTRIRTNNDWKRQQRVTNLFDAGSEKCSERMADRPQ